MKVQIETTPRHSIHNAEPLIVLNGIVRTAIKSKSLKDLQSDLKNIDTYGFKFGFGSSHCWVKQINLTGDKSESDRILLITENQ